MPNLLPLALKASACFIAFLAASGFLLGQLFFASFSLPSFIAGTAGLVSAAATYAMTKRAKWARRWVILGSALSLFGVALSAGRHYIYFDVPGNHFAWEIICPYAACLAFVAHIAMTNNENGTSDA